MAPVQSSIVKELLTDGLHVWRVTTAIQLVRPTRWARSVQVHDAHKK